jgi:hypothetical protein
LLLTKRYIISLKALCFQAFYIFIHIFIAPIKPGKMKLPSSSAIVMLTCGVVFFCISMAIAGINLFDFKSLSFLNQPLNTFSAVLYFTELTLMSYLLLLTNDHIRAFSYFLYTVVSIVSNLIFTFFPNNTALFPVIGTIAMLSLINIVIQSFFIKNSHLTTPYRIFTLTAAGVVVFKMMMPYLAQTFYLPISSIAKLTVVTGLLSSAVMLYLVIKIYMLSKFDAKAN